MRSTDQIRADLDVLASRDWLSKGDEGIAHRLAADVGPLLDHIAELQAQHERDDAAAERLVRQAEAVNRAAGVAGVPVDSEEKETPK